MRTGKPGPGEGLHVTNAIKAPTGCRESMGIETCFECKLPDCDEARWRHWLRDESKREEKLEIS